MKLEQDTKSRFSLVAVGICAVAVCFILGVAAVSLMPKGREDVADTTPTETQSDEPAGGAESQWSDEDKRVEETWTSQTGTVFDPYSCPAIENLAMPEGLSKYLLQESIATWAIDGNVSALKDVRVENTLTPDGEDPMANQYGWTFVGTSVDTNRQVSFTTLYNAQTQNFETYSQH